MFGNTDLVFRKSYNPRDLRVNLMDKVLKRADGGNDQAIAKPHESFTKRDCFAPIYITEEDLEVFEARKDISRWRQEIQGFPNRSCEEARRLLSNIQQVNNALETKLLEQRRQAYFDEVDRLRSKGQSTAHLHHVGTTNPRFKQSRLSSKAAEELAPYFIAGGDAQDLADRLVAYVRGVLYGEASTDATVTKPTSKSRSRCLYGCGSWAARSSLTKHVRSRHMEKFQQPFTCPESQRLGQQEH